MTDGHRIKREAHEIAYPRASGSPGDERAITWLCDRMRETGLTTQVERFSYDIGRVERVIRVGLLAAALLVAAGGLSMHTRPVVGLLLVAGAMAPGLVFLAWSPRLEEMYRDDGPTASANVSCTRPGTDPGITIVVMAHHDSKSQNLGLVVRAALTTFGLAGAAALTAAGLVGAVTSSSPLARGTTVAIGCVTGAAMLVLSTLRSGNASPGGVDNAGSVAILLDLSRRLPKLVGDDAELVFLSTGAEEDHMVGAMRWLEAHGARCAERPTYCLNFDGAGAPGRVVLIERYGFGRQFSPILSRTARRAASKLGLRPRGIVMIPGVGIDAIPFAHRGIPCLTLASGSLGRATMSVHSPRDRAEHLDPTALAQVADLAVEIVRDLASDTRPDSRTAV